jgi:hypothetical protein
MQATGYRYAQCMRAYTCRERLPVLSPRFSCTPSTQHLDATRSNFAAANMKFFRSVIVIILAALLFSSAESDEKAEWSPSQTRSERVPFAPEFSGQHSDQTHPETLRQISAIHSGMRTHGRFRTLGRTSQATSASSPFSRAPRIASIHSTDSQ